MSLSRDFLLVSSARDVIVAELAISTSKRGGLTKTTANRNRWYVAITADSHTAENLTYPGSKNRTHPRGESYFFAHLGGDTYLRIKIASGSRLFGGGNFRISVF